MAEVFATARAFRDARDAWWSARTSAKAGATSDASKVAAQARRKEERWTLSGKRYLRAYKGLDGKLFRYPDELLRLTEDLIEGIAPKLARAFDKRLGRVAFDAWSKWPVSTGLSKSLIDLEYEQRGDQFIGRVVSRAPYTVFVNRGQTYKELIKVPGREAARKILDDLARDDGKGGARGV